MIPAARFAAAAAALAAFLAGPVRAGEDGPLGLSGYLKSFTVGYKLAEADGAGPAAELPLLGQSSLRLRLALDYAPSDAVTVQAAYDLSPRVQDPLFFRASPFGAPIAAGAYRATDFRNPIVPGPGDAPGSFGLYHNLDRLSVRLRTRFGDLVVGRQPVAWGSGRVTSPTDVIAPFSFYELDKEERFGVDAVRLRVPLSTLGELDAGYVFGARLRFARSAFFVRGRAHAAGTDFGAVVVGFQRDLLVGVDVARALGGSGVWLEAAWVSPDEFAPGGPKPSDYARLTAGIDRSLGDRLYGFLEYHFSSAGSSRPSGYVAGLSRPAYTRGTAYLMGRHYLAAGATWQATPLLPVTGLLLWNAGDGSMAFAPQAEYNLGQDVYVGGGVSLGLGRRPAVAFLDALGRAPLLGSEFGSYPDFGYLSVRVYF